MANIVITAANVTKNSGNTIATGIAGEAIGAGQSIYVSAADKLLYLTDAAVADKPAVGEVTAVALNSAAVGQIVPYLRRDGDEIAYGAGVLVAGQYYVASATAGGIMPASDLASTNYSVLVGYAADTSVLVLLRQATGVVLA